jgi:hypothetical protein
MQLSYLFFRKIQLKEKYNFKENNFLMNNLFINLCLMSVLNFNNYVMIFSLSIIKFGNSTLVQISY